MTEAMSRHEIEDVLSSIRRLVSHDDQGKKAAPNKLVLTSALRVDTAAAAEEPAETAPEMAQTFAPDPNPEVADLSAPVAKAAPASAPALPAADTSARAPLLTRIAQAGKLPAPRPEPNATAEPAGAPVAGTAPAEQDSGNDAALEATLARLEQALSIAPATQDRDEETLIDEAALAELVSRIVRQELQGELGARITRNIRKLVRAEVARELQMRNL